MIIAGSNVGPGMQQNLAIHWLDPSEKQWESNKKIPPNHIALVDADLLNSIVNCERPTASPIQAATLHRPGPN